MKSWVSPSVWVCGDLWFLAQLFVSPDQQGRGIGQELLQRTFQHAVSAKAATKALITFAFNGVSQGLYMRHGLFPRCPIYNVEISREVLIRSLPEGGLRCAPLDGTASHFDSLASIDARALGVSRARHHRFLMIAATNAHAALDYAYELLGVKSPSEFIELSTAHARKQFEAMAAQTRELTELAQKVTTEIAANEWRHADTKSHKVA